MDITKFHWIDGSCCFLSLFSCQGSVFEAGCILLVPYQPVKGFGRRKRRCYCIGPSDCKTNRFVSLTRDCFSVVNDLPWGTRSELNVLAKFDYTRLSGFVKVNLVLVRQLNLKKCRLMKSLPIFKVRFIPVFCTELSTHSLHAASNNVSICLNKRRKKFLNCQFLTEIGCRPAPTIWTRAPQRVGRRHMIPQDLEE